MTRGVPSGAAAGLVSVPTTPTGARGLPEGLVLANLAGSRKDAERASGGFIIDKAGRRYSSLRMAVGFAARAHGVSDKGSRTDKAWMVTLTYAGDNSSWSPEHLTRAVDAFRIWCKRSGFACRYVWVAELQKRGVIHYHLAAWLPAGQRMPKWDRRGWWPYGMSNTLKAKHATAYLMAYLKKGDLEQRGSLPKGARNYGVGGLDKSLRRARRWLSLPSFVQGNSAVGDKSKRAKGGGWIIGRTGEWLPSEWGLSVRTRTSAVLVRVCTHSREIQDPRGPFSWVN